MTGVIYQIMFHPRVGVIRFYQRYSDRKEALRQCRQLNNDVQDGLYFIKTIYPIAEMKTEKFDEFIALVTSVREAQKKFYVGRDHQDMLKAMTLEDRLRKYIEKCKQTLAAHPQYKPQPTSKAYFDIVDTWLKKTKEYFYHKKANDEDKDVLRERLRECKDFEARIDLVLEEYAKYQSTDK